jgi:hypothetical protein
VVKNRFYRKIVGISVKTTKFQEKVVKKHKKVGKRQNFSQKPEKHEFIEKNPCRKRLCFW